MKGKGKGHMAIIIAVKPPGGKAPKKPTKTADVDKCNVGVSKVKKAPEKDCQFCSGRGAYRKPNGQVVDCSSCKVKDRLAALEAERQKVEARDTLDPDPNAERDWFA